MNINKHISALLALSALWACQGNDVDRSKSILDGSATTVQTAESDFSRFDQWLEVMYRKPYNIDLKYRFEDIESDMDKNLTPVDFRKAIQFAHLTEHLCLEAYDSVTHSQEFIRATFPKVVHLVGSAAYNPNGSKVLGTAESGRKMTLYKVNELNPGDIKQMNEDYFQTIHHEFGHIQNQLKPYPTSFQSITPSGYVTDEWQYIWASPSGARELVLSELSSSPQHQRYTKIVAEGRALLKKGRDKLTEEEKKRLAEIEREVAELRRDPEVQEAERSITHFNRFTTGRNNLITNQTINALRAGFISAYASSQHAEDFVEIQSIYITDSPMLWEAKMIAAGKKGRPLLERKLEIVRSYLQSEWGINLDELRDEVQRRQTEIPTLPINSIDIVKNK